MSDNSKRIKKVFKYVNQFSKYDNKLQKALEKLEWPIEIFFISLTNEIIIELEKINTKEQFPKTHKRISSNITNNNIYIEKSGKSYLYQMINIFDEIQKYKNQFPNDIIEYIITPENIQKILLILMATNKVKSTNPNIIKERNEFNGYIMNLLINIINLNNKILIDVLSSQSQYNVFYQLFTLLSKNVENRNLLYDLERNIFLYYPDNDNLKELINYTIDCIDEELNKNNCKAFINEIKVILFLYKKEINIIKKMMMKIIIKIFSLLEDEIRKHYFINDFLKFCFNEICFDGNNKFYSRYTYVSTNKSKTLSIRTSNISLENNPDKRNSQKINNNKNDSINSNINNLIRGSTIEFNNTNDIEKKLNDNNNNNNNNNSDQNDIIIDKDKDDSINNKLEPKIIQNEDNRNYMYNPQFMNFLFDIYNEFINSKMINSCNIFFIELFLSINNSDEGKREYSFLINDTNYIKIVLTSLLKLKDESLIAVYFSKLIFLSISNKNNDSETKKNDYYLPEIDLYFLINNIYLFLEEDENGKILIVISSQIINLLKMNNNIIDIILNKCNIFESFLSILNNEKYKNEAKKEIIDLMESILEINNNKFKYILNIPIITYNITDYLLIKKIYLISLKFENNINELKNKILLIVNYMDSLINQNKIQELFIFFEILLDGLYKNILKISNYKIIDDETINKINKILFDISMIIKNETIIDFKYYNELIFILLKFQYNYNKKYIYYYLNEIPIDKKNKIIIEEKSIIIIIKNILIKEQNLHAKMNLLNYLLLYCLDINDNNFDNININTINNKENNNNNDNNNNYLLKGPNILIKIIDILYELKDYISLDFLINNIILLINNSFLNIKIILYNKRFIQILIKLLIELYHNKDEEKLFTKINILLNELSKYLSEPLLIQYLSEIYFIFHSTIENQSIIIELFNIIKNGIINSKKNNYDYLSLSNVCFNNPYIYNTFYIKGLNFDESINIYLCIDININISTYNNIGIFHIINFINEKKDTILSFSITDEKKLIISENSFNDTRKEIISEIKNINEIIMDDFNFHKISIIINTKEKKIFFNVDQDIIQINNNNSYNYNLFEFSEFDISIGYKSDIIKSKLEINKSLNNIPIININNILLTKFNEIEEYDNIINKKKELGQNIILLENINNNKNYFENNNKSIENNIIFELNFKNININVIKSNKIKNELKILNDFLSNNNSKNKLISWFNIYIPSYINTVNNYFIKFYMISFINNLEEYYSFNNSNNIILYNINKKYMQTHNLYNYNTALNACNYSFIDFLICFIFDMEKKRKKIKNINNNEKNETENENEIGNENLTLENDNDTFLNDILLIIFEIIIELPRKEIIDYFLYKNDIISVKLKIYFYRNINCFNKNNEFIEKLFYILSPEQKPSIIEEDNNNNNNQEFLLVIISEILLDLLIFQKLDFKIQNIILIKLIQLLFTSLNYQNYYNILYILLKQIYNIILYYELSLEKINYNLDEENNNPTQVDIFIKLVNSLMIIFETNKDQDYIDKIANLNININNFYINFTENNQKHCVGNFIKDNKNLIENNFLGNDTIYNQLQKIITKCKINEFENKENSFINKEDLYLNNNNFKNKCIFCLYIHNYFKIKYENIYSNIKFDKFLDNNYINIFLNFYSYREILGKNNYAWFLSRNESSHKIQNKFFLKKNDIDQKKQLKKRINGEAYTYEYIYDKEKYILTLKSLYQLFLFDRICNDFCLINSITKICEKETNSSIDDTEIIENCLYIKNIHRTLSIIIILKEYILLLTNICVDNNNKLHVVKKEIDVIIWCLQKKEEYEKELEDYISKNDQILINELFTNDTENSKNKKENGFGYNNSFNFSYKKIYFKNISEIHKVSYLTIPNSLEIFLKNGKSYFLCLNIMKRDKIYMDIISKIFELYKNKNHKLEGYTDFFLKKSSKNIFNENFYMKYCPITYLENNTKEYSTLFGLKKSLRKKTNSVHSSYNYNHKIAKINYNKAIISVNTFLSEATDLWAKNKISNYDYIMLLNILSGRSLNNLSQYFIFPRLLNNFSNNILNWISPSIYRDLSYPILSSDPLIKEDIKKKYDLIDSDKYHSGTFYSNYAFVSYFLIRQRPFSEISLEIQGGEFDASDRLFIGAKEMCNMKEKYQESIPPLLTLPELYINNNKFNFGKTQKKQKLVNDFELPNWCKDDPRKFTLVIKRIFESKNVNLKLNKWIDLIFGVAQSGPEAIKFLNTYRKACYEISLEEIEELKKNNELFGILIEKQELGYNAKQLFKKSHKKKDIPIEYKEYENSFFDTNLKLRKIKFKKINNNDYNKEKKNILFNSINDFLIDIDNNDYINNININNNFQGGISSLKSVFSAFNENTYNSISQKYNTPVKIINILEKTNKFIILGNGYHFLGKNYDYILCYKNQFLEIINYKLDIYYCYYLNESSDISTLISNNKGNKIYIGFNNGNIIEYKIIFEEEEEFIQDQDMNKNENRIYPTLKLNVLDKLSIKYNNIYIYNLDNDNLDKNIALKRSDTKKSKKKPKISQAIPIISLQKNLDNNFVFNNPHIPEKIIKIKLNEETKVLIAMTESNIIYLISLNNKFKLMHIITYYNNYKFQYKIKDIIPFSYNGDFLIYSSMKVHLFSINGVPLCELNLLDKAYESITQITCCTAIFLYDVILFTGHEDGSIIIWKIKNKNTFQNNNEIENDEYNNNNKKSYLNEYYYNYDLDIDANNNNYNIQECQLKREFEIVSQIKMEEDINNLSINYIKISHDMSYMIILDNKKDIYIVSNFDDYREEYISNTSSSNSLNININTGVFGYFKERKILCLSCNNEIEDNYYRSSIESNRKSEMNEDYTLSNKENTTKIEDENNSNNNENKNNNDNNYICEECRLKLKNTESYLYNY